MDRAKIITLLSIFLILNILDIVLTVSVISEGKGLEVNPVMAYLLENSFAVFTAVKITAGFFIALLLFRLYKKHVKAAKITATIIIAAYVFIVANNAVVSAETVSESGIANIQICKADYFSIQYQSVSGSYVYPVAKILGIYMDFDQYPEPQSIDFYIAPIYGTTWKWVLALYINNTYKYMIDDTNGAVGFPIKLTYNGKDVIEGQMYVYPIYYNNNPAYNIKIIFDIFSFNKSNVASGYKYYAIEYLSDWDVRLQSKINWKTLQGGPGPQLRLQSSASSIPTFTIYNNPKVTYCSAEIKDNYYYTYEYNETTGIESGWLNVTKTGGESKWGIYYKSYLTNETYYQLIDTNLNTNNFTWRLSGYLLNATVYYTSTDYRVVTFTQPNFSTYSPPSGTSTITFYFMDIETGALVDNVNFTLQESFIGNSTVLNGTYDYSVTVNNLNDLEVYTYTASRAGYETATGNVYYPPAGQETTVYVYLTPIKTPSNANNSVITFRVISNFSNYQIALPDAVVTLNGETKLTNAQGYVSFEVPKNNTYSYIVSKDGYFSKGGVITATQDYHSVVVQLFQLVQLGSPIPTPTGTPTSGSGTGTDSTGTGGTGTSTGYTADEGLRQAARDTLTNYYQIIPGFFGLVFLLFFMATLNGVWRRRR